MSLWSAAAGRARPQTWATGMSKEQHRQVFGRPTFDSAFKIVMNDESILKIFSKLDDVRNVEIQDVSSNQVKVFTNARTVLNDSGLRRLLSKFSNSSNVSITCQGSESAESASTVTLDGKELNKLSTVFEDIKGTFPQPERDSRLELLCKLDTDEMVMVEVQVVIKKSWDNRALAYCAGINGHQLRRGEKWDDLKRVIAISLLPGQKNW